MFLFVDINYNYHSLIYYLQDQIFLMDLIVYYKEVFDLNFDIENLFDFLIFQPSIPMI
jgi:hypothetical protein